MNIFYNYLLFFLRVFARKCEETGPENNDKKMLFNTSHKNYFFNAIKIIGTQTLMNEVLKLNQELVANKDYF